MLPIAYNGMHGIDLDFVHKKAFSSREFPVKQIIEQTKKANYDQIILTQWSIKKAGACVKKILAAKEIVRTPFFQFVSS